MKSQRLESQRIYERFEGLPQIVFDCVVCRRFGSELM